MYVHTGTWSSPTAPARAINWRGHSGHYYALHEEQIDSFSLSDNDLYVLAANNIACWVGTARDLIDDSSSRARFRAAIKACSAVFRLEGDVLDDVKRVTTAWDLENGHMAGNLKLVGAN